VSQLKWQVLVTAALLTSASLAAAQKLQVLAPSSGVEEFNLYDATRGGHYVKSVDIRNLTFPIPVVEERSLGFVIRLSDGNYFVGASDVETNKVYDTSASCDSKLVGPTGASRGITGLGCK